MKSFFAAVLAGLVVIPSLALADIRPVYPPLTINPLSPFVIGHSLSISGPRTVQDGGLGLNAVGNIVMSHGSGVGQQAFYYKGSVSGTCDGTITLAAIGPDCAMGMDIILNNDILSANGQSPSTLQVVDYVGGNASTIGGRGVVNIQLVALGGTGDSGVDNPAYGGLNVTAMAQGNVGGSGSGSNARGGVFAEVLSPRLQGSATFYGQMVGEEIDMQAAGLSSVNQEIGIQIVNTSSDTVHGSLNADFAVGIGGSNAVGQTLWDCGYCFGTYNGYNSIASTGTLIGTINHNGSVGGGSMGTVAYGIDLSQYTYTSDSIKVPGFIVDPAGRATTAGLQLSSSINFSGDNGPSNAWIYSTNGGTAFSGTCTNTVTCYLNYISSGDGVDASAASNGLVFTFLNDTQVTGAKGPRFGLWVETNAVQTPANGPYMVAITAQGEADANASGVGSSANWAMNSYAVMNGSGYLSNISYEADMACKSSCNALYSDGVEVVLLGSNRTAATRENVAFAVSAQSSATPTIDTAFAIGQYQGVNPMASTGFIMRWLPNNAAWTSGATGPSITAGIDLINFTFSGNAFRSTGFHVDGSGNTAGITVQTTTVYSAAGTPLPTCNGAAEGTHAAVSDANGPTYGANYASGGAVHTTVYCNGSNWKTT